MKLSFNPRTEVDKVGESGWGGMERKIEKKNELTTL